MAEQIAEDDGKLGDARKHWEGLSKKKSNAGPDMHAWGLVGERHLQELTKIDALYTLLQHEAKKKTKH